MQNLNNSNRLVRNKNNVQMCLKKSEFDLRKWVCSSTWVVHKKYHELLWPNTWGALVQNPLLSEKIELLVVFDSSIQADYHAFGIVQLSSVVFC